MSGIPPDFPCEEPKNGSDCRQESGCSEGNSRTPHAGQAPVRRMPAQRAGCGTTGPAISLGTTPPDRPRPT